MSGAIHEVLGKTIDDRSNRDMHGEAKIIYREMKSFVFICFYLIKLFLEIFDILCGALQKKKKKFIRHIEYFELYLNYKKTFARVSR